MTTHQTSPIAMDVNNDENQCTTPPLIEPQTMSLELDRADYTRVESLSPTNTSRDKALQLAIIGSDQYQNGSLGQSRSPDSLILDNSTVAAGGTVQNMTSLHEAETILISQMASKSIAEPDSYRLTPTNVSVNGLAEQSSQQAGNSKPAIDLPLSEKVLYEETTRSHSHTDNDVSLGSQVEECTVTEPCTGKIKRSERAQTFRKPENLPGEDADLTHEQIADLLYQARTVRSKYKKYFAATGLLRMAYIGIAFERNSKGDLRHPPAIINSNVRKWEEAFQLYETNSAAGATRRKRTTSIPAKRAACQDLEPEDHDAPDAQKKQKKQNRGKRTSKPSAGPQEEHPPTEPSPMQSLPAQTPAMQPLLTQSPFTQSPPVQASHAHDAGRAFSPIFVPPIDVSALALPGPVPCTGVPISHLGNIHNLHPTTQASCQAMPRLSSLVEHPYLVNAMAPAALHHEPGLSDLRRYFNNDLCHYIKHFNKGDLNLLNQHDLTSFIKWMESQAHTLNHNLVAFAITKQPDYQKLLTEVLTRLYRLRSACFNLLNELEEEKESEGNSESDGAAENDNMRLEAE